MHRLPLPVLEAGYLLQEKPALSSCRADFPRLRKDRPGSAARPSLTVHLSAVTLPVTDSPTHCSRPPALVLLLSLFFSGKQLTAKFIVHEKSAGLGAKVAMKSDRHLQRERRKAEEKIERKTARRFCTPFIWTASYDYCYFVLHHFPLFLDSKDLLLHVLPISMHTSCRHPGEYIYRGRIASRANITHTSSEQPAVAAKGDPICWPQTAPLRAAFCRQRRRRLEH